VAASKSQSGRSGPSDTALGDLAGLRRLRRRNAWRARRKWIIAVVVALAVLAGAVVTVFFAPLFAVRTVRVEGNTLATADEVRAAAGVTVGEPMSRVRTNIVEANVKKLPVVQSVSVSRSWPHTVVVKITEVGLVYQRQDGDQYQWIDAAGDVFRTGSERLAVPLANTPDTSDRTLLKDVGVVAAALPAEVKQNLASITGTSIDMILLTLNDGRQIVWGSSDDSALKAQVIVPLLATPGRVYDVSAPTAPAITP
jgi:cell division protein FtsQ